MINEVQQLTVIKSKSWIWLGLLITRSVLAINFIGDRLCVRWIRI